MPHGRRSGGFTMIEVLLSSSIVLLAISTLVYAQINLLRGWESGLQREQTTRSAQAILRTLRQTLLEVGSVSVNSSGTSLSYQRLVRDNNGNYTLPVALEETVHTLTVNWDSGNLSHDNQVLLTGVSSSGPNGSYRPFTLIQVSPDVAVLHIRLNVRRQVNTPNHPEVYSWVEDTIFLRNLQQ